jgi:hypothetical protein
MGAAPWWMGVGRRKAVMGWRRSGPQPRRNCFVDTERAGPERDDEATIHDPRPRLERRASKGSPAPRQLASICEAARSVGRRRSGVARSAPGDQASPSPKLVAAGEGCVLVARMRADHQREQCLSCRHSRHETLVSFDTGNLVRTKIMDACLAPPMQEADRVAGARAGICLGWEPSEKEAVESQPSAPHPREMV